MYQLPPVLREHTGRTTEIARRGRRTHRPVLGLAVPATIVVGIGIAAAFGAQQEDYPRIRALRRQAWQVLRPAQQLEQLESQALVQAQAQAQAQAQPSPQAVHPLPCGGLKTEAPSSPVTPRSRPTQPRQYRSTAGSSRRGSDDLKLIDAEPLRETFSRSFANGCLYAVEISGEILRVKPQLPGGPLRVKPNLVVTASLDCAGTAALRSSDDMRAGASVTLAQLRLLLEERVVVTTTTLDSSPCRYAAKISLQQLRVHVVEATRVCLWGPGDHRP